MGSPVSPIVANLYMEYLEQEKILSWGPNFAIVPKCPPVGKYIASIEHACSQLKQGEVEELGGEIKTILKKIHPPSQISP